MPISESRPAVVIGAGPYGLAVAAHLRASGVPVRVFGEVMTTWRDHMPAGMFLKSAPFASSISAPVPGFTLAAFCARSGLPALGEDEPVPIDLFIRYGQWFAEQLVPGIEPRQVRRLERGPRGFELTLDDGEELATDTVVMANGVIDFAYVPGELADGMPKGPANAVSHSSQHHDLSKFAGQDVAVIGAGQSALESAALLHEAGARVQVLTRGQARFGSPPKPQARGLGAAAAEAALSARADVADLPLQPRRRHVPVPTVPDPAQAGEAGAGSAGRLVAARSGGRPDSRPARAADTSGASGRKQGPAHPRARGRAVHRGEG